ncbi:hypothetical protein FHS61_002804 [Altererythrobacter atlanticus]|uniref:hypothetical protein n=1 Tax=Croceibacterium atlanticum TaxID=1267766 RepID=UPI0012E0DBD6|nr:hypothetical protein [Croceibacterium atlanticum]MBB5733761.1 hypothetical protein [Croceibacterium atlanticum]
MAPAIRQADHVLALIEGELDPAISAEELFRFSLTGADALRMRAVARLVQDDALFTRASENPDTLDSLSAEQARLALAEARFLRLPERRRQALLQAHAKAHEAFRQQRDRQQSATQELDRLTRELAGLRAFLAGEAVNPDFLKVNPLAASGDTAEMAVLGGPAPEDAAEPAADAPAAQRMAWLRDQIILAKRRIFQLPRERLAALEESAGLSSGAADAIAFAQAELDDVRLELSNAEQAAINAANEQERLIASERARLLQTSQAQAQFRSELARSTGEAASIIDDALSWRRRGLEAAAAGNDNASQLYDDLVVELARIRQRLRQALDTPEYPPLSALRPPAIDRALPDNAPETLELRRQVQELERGWKNLQDAYANRLWERRNALRDAMNLLNEARLALLPSLTSRERSRVTGFGAEGVAQVRREISEIVLELRFSVQSWRRTLSEILTRIMSPSPAFVLSMLRIAMILIFFAWWRRRGDGLLARAQADAATRRPRTMARSLQTAALRNWREIRAPLDWLILAILLWWLWPEELAIESMVFVWIVLFWSLVTVTLVRLVNELAKGRTHEDPRASLRWKSLKLIAGSLLAIGLLLNLTQASVGRGAIHNWVSTIAWLLVPVVALLLAHWWRQRIVALAEAEAGESMLLRWMARDPGGITGLLGRIAVGLLLLAKGVRAIISRRLRDMALVREMLDQRARIVAERRVAEDKASGRFRRLPPEITAAFDPHRPPSKLRVGDERPGHALLPEIPPGSLTLVVGERGLGKSSYLRDLAEKSSKDSRIVAMQAPPANPAEFLDDLAAATRPGVKGGAAQEQVFVTVDDIQRLIVPAIGGLNIIERLVALARTSGPNCRWVFSISQESWRFLQRARNDRILFDTVISLPHWSAGELRALIERRTAQAKLSPDFSAMTDDGIFEFGEDVSATERRKRGYFERLTDYASGNPAIALDYWRQSLFVDSISEQVTVRTFDTPPVESLSALPMSALFVLRAMVQMDLVSKETIRTSTDLSDMLVSDALRRLERLGTITCDQGTCRISLHWWIEVVRLLARQNLIVREKR